MTALQRSMLFVPVTSGRKLDMAFAGPADGVIVDLEDAVEVDPPLWVFRTLRGL